MFWYPVQGSASYSHSCPQLRSIFKQITRPIPKVLFREWMNATEEGSWSRFLCLSRQVDLLYFSSTLRNERCISIESENCSISQSSRHTRLYSFQSCLSLEKLGHSDSSSFCNEELGSSIYVFFPILWDIIWEFHDSLLLWFRFNRGPWFRIC